MAVSVLMILTAVAHPAQVRAKATSPGAGAPALAPQAPVARVNGAPITAGELQPELSRLLPPTAAHGAVDRPKRARLRKLALEELVIRQLGYWQAGAGGLKAEAAAVNATSRKIRGRYKTEASFQEALRAEQITRKEFVHRIEKELLLRKIHKLEIEDKAAVSETEIRQYYEKDKASLLLPESIHLKPIRVRHGPDEAAAKMKIVQALERLKAGECFPDVAYRFLKDDYRVAGGDYGSVQRGRLPPEIEKAAFVAKGNTLTGPFRSNAGRQILRVEARQPQRQLQLEEVRQKIEADLRKKRLAERKTDFGRRLKQGARIE